MQVYAVVLAFVRGEGTETSCSYRIRMAGPIFIRMVLRSTGTQLDHWWADWLRKEAPTASVLATAYGSVHVHPVTARRVSLTMETMATQLSVVDLLLPKVTAVCSASSSSYSACEGFSDQYGGDEEKGEKRFLGFLTFIGQRRCVP